jgi:gliding motility-associated-like protein
MQLEAQGYGLAPLKNMPCGLDEVINCAQTDSTQDIPIYYSGGVSIPSDVYTPFPAYRTARIQILVRKDDLRRYQLHTGTLRSLSLNVGTPTPTQYYDFTMSLKCTDRTSIKDATGGMESGATLVYTAPGPLAVTAGWNKIVFDTPYSWDSTKNLIIEICYNNPAAGTAAIIMAANDTTSSMAIRYANNGSTGICQNPALSPSTTYYGSRPVVKFDFCRADTVPFPYTWAPGTFLSDSTAANPLAYVPQSTTYTVSTYGRNGCKVVDTVKINVPVHEYDVWPRDTTFCQGQPFLAKAIGDFATVKWYEDTMITAAVPTFGPATSLSCDDCTEPVGTPAVSTNYFAVMTDADGCSDTMMVRAVVKPLPIVNILNRDTTLKYGQSLQLLVSGAFLYSWQPLSTLTNPNIVNPVATPTEPTRYYVYGVAENGCRNEDSILINVDYRDNLFVPSAFTPNGDGKNDVFRVANITFQRLLEFRVFNRWGQEIYSTNDPRKGWDGSWKGVPQDIGVYQYLIRVAYPDGLVESYKGNVSLVR